MDKTSSKKLFLIWEEACKRFDIELKIKVLEIMNKDMELSKGAKKLLEEL